MGSGCPCQAEAAGHPTRLAMGVRDGVTEVPGGGQLRDGVSAAGEVPCAREVAGPLGVKSGTRGGEA